MAARINSAWKFYVYEVLDTNGLVIYVGKGSGGRKNASRNSRRGASVREVARFKCESDAYAYEVERIAQERPPMNKTAGGEGGLSSKKRKRHPYAWEREIASVGVQAYAARLLFGYNDGCAAAGVNFPGDASKVELIRSVYHG